MKKLIDETVIDLAEFICESDAIENIQDDRDLVIEQIETCKKDGHVGAMLMLEELAQSSLNQGGHTTDELICKLQGLITAEQHLKPGGPCLNPKYIGRYRPEYVSVTVGGRLCLSSSLVPAEMAKLLGGINLWQLSSWFQEQDYNIRRIADFHFRFEIIHPFADGNGRTGRALAYYLMQWAGLKPIIFTNNDKLELYYPCFRNPDDPSLMQRYFLIKMGRDPDAEVTADKTADWYNEGGQ